MVIMRIIRWIISFFKKHKREAIYGAAGLGAAGAGAGIFNAHKAKKINRQALDIQQAALEKHEQAYQETQQVLTNLGETEKSVIDSFVHFADTMERIQGRPKMRATIFSSVKLPNYEPEEIKQLSTNVQMAIAGAGGIGAGVLAGLAAFGVGTLMAAPTIAGVGLVLCVKGHGLKRKAIKNKRQAKQMEKSVDEIIAFYADIRKAADSFKEIISTVYHRYNIELKSVENTLTAKTTWKQFSREEKKSVENTVMLARLLYSMTQAKIVVRQDGKPEAINTDEIAKLQGQATKMLAGLS